MQQTLNPQGFTFGGTSNMSPSVIRKTKDALPIPSIPEESYSKDKQSDEPVIKKMPKPHKNLARHSSIVSTSLNERSFGGNTSIKCPLKSPRSQKSNDSECIRIIYVKKQRNSRIAKQYHR